MNKDRLTQYELYVRHHPDYPERTVWSIRPVNSNTPIADSININYEEAEKQIRGFNVSSELGRDLTAMAGKNYDPTDKYFGMAFKNFYGGQDAYYEPIQWSSVDPLINAQRISASIKQILQRVNAYYEKEFSAWKAMNDLEWSKIEL